MSAAQDLAMEYLQPDFDPNSLTMPKLRGILVAHNVAYPGSAKKGQLVDLFNENVASQARKLLGARARTKRSARGIEDVPSSAEPSVDGEELEDDERPARTPRRASRRPTQMSVEESPERPTTATRSGRQSTSKYAKSSDVDHAPPTGRKISTAAKKTRLSSSTPTVKQEDEDRETYQPDRRESAFSSENVFQSGSSPSTEAPSTSRRRTNGSGEVSESKRSASRRKQDSSVVGLSANGRVSSPTRRPRTPSSRRTQIVKEEEEVSPEVGEEFTPEETQDLARATESGTVARPTRKRAPLKKRSTVATLAPIAITLAMLGGIGTVWREEKLAVGFCGVGRAPTTMLAGVEIPEWARDVVQPHCEPCPSHAFCYTNLQASCDDDFVLVPHPLSLGGVVPLPPTCVPDGEKARKVQAVADRAVEELRERNAKFECGELRDRTTGKRADSAEIKEPELKASVSSKRKKGMSDREFEELWHSALGELMDRDEIIGDVDSTSSTPTRTLRSTSLARVPLSCALRRSLRLALVRYLKQLVVLLSFLAAATYGYTTFTSSREMEGRAKQLATFAMDRLAQQAAWANYYGDESVLGEDGTSEGKVLRFVGVAQLRDDVLRDEFSARRRQKLWERVQRKVEENANVRSAVREGQSGEVGRVWEWIGAVGSLEWDGGSAGNSGGRRASGRRSLPSQGPYVGSSPLAGVSSARRGRDEREIAEAERWDEGRPIY